MRSVIALVGVSEYRDSRQLPLPQAARNIDILGHVLTASLVVGISVEVRRLLNPASSDELAGFVATAALAAEDLLLIYFCGHGLITSEGKLALTHALTPVDNADYHALEYDKIRRACRSSPANRRVVILDCCYSGAAVEGLLGGQQDLRGRLHASGSYVLTSSSSTRESYVLPGEEMTAFTGRLVRLLRQQDAAIGPLSLDALVARLRVDLNAEGLPLPQVVDNNQLGDTPLFRPVGSGKTHIPVVPSQPGQLKSAFSSRRADAFRAGSTAVYFFVLGLAFRALAMSFSGDSLATTGLNILYWTSVLFVLIMIILVLPYLLRPSFCLIVNSGGLHITRENPPRWSKRAEFFVRWRKVERVTQMAIGNKSALVLWESGENSFPLKSKVASLPPYYDSGVDAVVLCYQSNFTRNQWQEIGRCLTRYAGAAFH
jgi:hypothetical protein